MAAREEPSGCGWAFDDFGVRAVYLLALLLGCLAAAQSDTFWLLRAGRDFWHTGRIAESDTWTYTVPGADWPNHEWLWEAIAYPLHVIGGMPLLTLANAFALAGALVVTIELARGRGPVRILLAAVLAISLVPEATLRPQATSALLFALTIMLVAKERYRWLPPMFLLWANLHGAVAGGGLVLAGCAAVAIGLAVRTREAAAVRRARRLTAVTGLCALATLVNPMGIGLWRYVLTSHSRSKANGVAEWLSPLEVHGPVAIGFWVFLGFVVGVALLRIDRIRCWHDAVPLVAAAVTLPTALDAIRNVTPFAIAAIPVLITMLAEAPDSEPDSKQSRVGHPAILLGIGGVLGAMLVAVVWVAGPPVLSWRPISPPAARDLTRCPGNVYTTYDTGGYVEWFAPSVRTYVDNRQDPFPNSLLRAARRLSEDGDFTATFSRLDIACAVVAPGSGLARSLHQARWQAAFQSDNVAIFVRR